VKSRLSTVPHVKVAGRGRSVAREKEQFSICAAKIGSIIQCLRSWGSKRGSCTDVVRIFD